MLAVFLVLGLLLVPWLGLDLYFHEKFNRQFIGYNIRGYRGDLLGRKKEGVFRVAFLGGSTALGYGVGPKQSLPYAVQEILCQSLGSGQAEVVNLGWNVQGVYSFAFTLQAYRNLQAETYVFYQGYTDAGINLNDWRKSSLFFRWTGYMPIWPLIFKEKAGALLAGGNTDDYYRNQIRFTPDLGARVTAHGLQTLAGASDSMSRVLARWAAQKNAETPMEYQDQKQPWSVYLAQTQKNVQLALEQGGSVLLLGQPQISPEWHRNQQAALHGFWREHYASNPRVGYLDLADKLDLRDARLAPDGMHLSPAGHKKLAPIISEALLRLRAAGGGPAGSAGPETCVPEDLEKNKKRSPSIPLEPVR